MKKVRDHYFQKAKKEGHAARSVYKLEEIDRRQGLLRGGMRVLDLGAAPGSWLLYAAGKVGEQGFVMGVDTQPLAGNFPSHVSLLKADIFHIGAEEMLADGPLFDLVMSDMAPKTTGIRAADAARSTELARRALALSEELLKTGGALLVKVFQGAGLPDLRRDFQEGFTRTTLEKPKASRAESVEIFLLGLGKLKN